MLRLNSLGAIHKRNLSPIGDQERIGINELNSQPIGKIPDHINKPSRFKVNNSSPDKFFDGLLLILRFLYTDSIIQRLPENILNIFRFCVLRWTG